MVVTLDIVAIGQGTAVDAPITKDGHIIEGDITNG